MLFRFANHRYVNAMKALRMKSERAKDDPSQPTYLMNEPGGRRPFGQESESRASRSTTAEASRIRPVTMFPYDGLITSSI